MSSPPASALQAMDYGARLQFLGFSEGLFHELHPAKYSLQELENLVVSMTDKLLKVPNTLFSNGRSPSLGEVLLRGQKLIPQIPVEIGLPWLFQNRNVLDRFGDKAFKSANQPVEITRGLFYYRLDQDHCFQQKYSDTAKWNIAIFVALLVKNKLTRNQKLNYGESPFTIKDEPKYFMLAFLEAVSEHHDNPATFSKRDEFIREWKKDPLELFIPSASMKNQLRAAFQALNDKWESHLADLQEKLPAREYNKRVRRFVGVLIPGSRERIQQFGLQRDDNGILFEESTTLYEAATTPTRTYRTNALRALEAPTDWNGDRYTATDYIEHVCNFQDAVAILETTDVADIVEVLNYYFLAARPQPQ